MTDTDKGGPPFPSIPSQDDIDQRARARPDTARGRLGRALAAMRLTPALGGRGATAARPNDYRELDVGPRENVQAAAPMDDFKVTLDDLVLEAEAAEKAEPIRFPYKG